MNWEDFKVTNWDTMGEMEQAAWLHKFVLGDNVDVDGNRFSLAGGIPAEFDANLVERCERSLDGAELELYVANCLTEASYIAYKGLEPEEVRTPEVARRFYEKLLLLPVEVRARCMYWAVRGERA